MKRVKLKCITALILAACLLAGICASPAAGDAQAGKKAITVKLDKKKVTLEKGESYKLKAKASPKKAKVSWKSSKPKVAFVSRKGKVSARAQGKAKVTATAAYKAKGRKYSAKASCTVIVKDAQPDQTPAPAQDTQPPANQPEGGNNVDNTIPVTSIVIGEDSQTINMKIGDEGVKIAPEILPREATLADCGITGTKDYVASVGTDGTVTAKYPGTTIVTISSKSDASVSASVRINVTDDFAPPEGFDEANPDIAHGSLEGFNYPSDYREGGTGHALAWFPPGYDAGKKYNLLLCLHGGMDNEYYWTNDNPPNGGCAADNVLDGLYAEGLMEDAIVVFPSGVINYDANKDYPNLKNDPPVGSDWINHYLLEYEILNNLLPYMRQQYPVMDGPEHTAICGLSMGCGQSFEIGFKNPDVFDYIGSFSAGPFEGENQQFVNSEADAAVMNDTVKLFFFMTGENDHLRDDSMRHFIDTCESYRLDHVFYEVPGVGHDDNCWNRCLYAFMKYAFK